nr:MAG TPA: hypothetical protein [Caudoviricetes sp.]
MWKSADNAPFSWNIVFLLSDLDSWWYGSPIFLSLYYLVSYPTVMD